MDIKQEWQNMNAEFDKNISYQNIASFNLDDHSNNLINDLQTKLKWKLNWLSVISLMFLLTAIFINSELKYLLLALCVIYYVVSALGRINLRKISTTIKVDSNTKQVLETNLSAVKRILRMENIFGYILLPISGPIGLLGYRLFLHERFETVLNLPSFPLQIGLFLLIGIPLIWVTKKMNERIFKMPINNLSEKINQLSSDG